MQRWFVAGVVVAGLVLALVLPLAVGSDSTGSRVLGRDQVARAFAENGLHLRSQPDPGVPWYESTATHDVSVGVYRKAIRPHSPVLINYDATHQAGKTLGYFIVAIVFVNWDATAGRIARVRHVLMTLRRDARANGYVGSLP